MSIKSRLKKLKKYLPQKLVFLFRMPDGTEKKLKLEEIPGNGGKFIRLVSGNDLKQVDKFLSMIDKEM